MLDKELLCSLFVTNIKQENMYLGVSSYCFGTLRVCAILETTPEQRGGGFSVNFYQAVDVLLEEVPYEDFSWAS